MDRVLPISRTVHHHVHVVVYTYSITDTGCMLCLKDEPQAAGLSGTPLIPRAGTILTGPGQQHFGAGWPAFAEDASPRGV